MRSTLFSVVAYLITIPLGVQAYKAHWMMPVLFTAPVWL